MNAIQREVATQGRRRQSAAWRLIVARLALFHRSAHFRSAFLLLFVFAVTAGTITVTARALKGPPHVEVLSDKLKDYMANRDRYSVLFLGTSRFYRTIVPDAVDAAMRENGCIETSYNFGVEGMFSVEREYLLDKLLTERPRSLKVIVTEDVMPSIGREADSSYLSDRVRYFYNLEYLSLFFHSLLSYPESSFETASRLFHLGEGYMREYSGAGQLASLLPKPGPDQGNTYNKAFLNNRGYLPLDAETDVWFERRRQVFAENKRWIVRERQEQYVKGAHAAHPRAEKRGAFTADGLARIAQQGIKPVFLVLPQERPETTLRAMTALIPQNVGTANILDYNDIAKYPQFFDRNLWFDTYHFNSSGARLVSALIGRDLCHAIKRQ